MAPCCRGAGRAERAAFAGAERERAVLGQQRAVARARVERRREAQHAHEVPEEPEAERLHLAPAGACSRARSASRNSVVALGVRVGRREADHDLGERGGGGVARHVGRQAHVQVLEIERREHVQLAVLLGEVLGLALAQELERGAEAALRPQRALRDGALHAVLPGGEPDDLRRFTVAERRQDDRRSDDQWPCIEIYTPPARPPRHAHSGGICTTAEPDRAFAERDGPGLAQLRVEHVSRSHLAARAAAGFDRVHAALAVHGDRRSSLGMATPCPAPRTTLLLSRLNSITPSVNELTKIRASASAATLPGAGAEAGKAGDLGPGKGIDHGEPSLAGEVVAGAHDVEQPVGADRREPALPSPVSAIESTPSRGRIGGGIDDRKPARPGRTERRVEVGVDHEHLAAGEDRAPDGKTPTGTSERGTGEVVDAGDGVEVRIAHVGDRVVHDRRAGRPGVVRQRNRAHDGARREDRPRPPRCRGRAARWPRPRARRRPMGVGVVPPSGTDTAEFGRLDRHDAERVGRAVHREQHLLRIGERRVGVGSSPAPGR